MKLSKFLLISSITTITTLLGISPKIGLWNKKQYEDKITIGIIHSLSGTNAILETKIVDSIKMAIYEINNNGGIKVRGKKYKIEYLLEDGASDPNTFKLKSEKLINTNKVAFVFGGLTTDSRKAMLPIYESNNALLFYPAKYEGKECSKNVFYFGASPNQLSIPATDFMYKRSPVAGKPFFLIGTDNLYSNRINDITINQVNNLGGQIVDERYIVFNNAEVASSIVKIKKSLPNGGVIINNLTGDQNQTFFKQLRKAGITPDNKYYVMSYQINEENIYEIGPNFLKDHYVAVNYLMNIETPSSKNFVKNFKKLYGQNRFISSTQESAYLMIFLWKNAVERANTFKVEAVRNAMIGQNLNAPQGLVEMFPNNHISQNLRITKINSKGVLEIIEEIGPIKPNLWNKFDNNINNKKSNCNLKR